jgi:hypothetical protein
MAQQCPRIDPLRPPTLPRDQPGLLKYAATCMPGTATSSGCADDQKYWAVVIPWAFVESNAPALGRSWTAPGGNRYWANVPGAPIETPTGKALLRLMASRSKMHTDNVFKNWDEYKNLPMSQVIQKTQGKLALDYGVMRVEIRPQPNETAKAFAQRGGYMLWIDPATGAFTSHQPIDWYKPPWLPDEISTCQLFGYYNLSTGRVEYSVRVEYRDTWEKVVRKVAGGIQWGFDKFCATVTGEKAQQAEVAVNMYQDLTKPPETSTSNRGTAGFGRPAGFGLGDAASDIATISATGAAAAMVTNPYAAAWLVAKAGCAMYTRAPEPCVPRTDQPLPPSPVYTTAAAGTWKGSMTASGASSSATIPGSSLDPRIFNPVIQPTTPAIPQPYPPGTIAWWDPRANGFLLAAPLPGPGTSHMIVDGSHTVPAVPPGVMRVERGEWDRATLPFLRRRSTVLGGVSVLAVLGASAVWLQMHR